MSRNLHWVATSSLVLLAIVLGCAPGWSEPTQAQSAGGYSSKPPGKSKKTKSGGQRGVVPADSTSESAPAASVGPYYALVIGINDYTYLNKLRTAVNDATAMAQLLQSKYGFQTRLLKNATRGEIMTALAEYRQTLKVNSNLLIYYAGHGYNDRDAAEAYWLPVNARNDNNAEWISADDITRAGRPVSSLHVMIVADSCYSGDLTRGSFNIELGERGAVLMKRLKSKSRTLMASGGDEPVADSGPGGHSVFAGALLQALDQMDQSAFTAADLYRSLESSVVKRSSQMPQYDSIPHAGHEFGDFIFSRGGARNITADNTSMVRLTGARDADLLAITDLVQGYETAYNSRDAGALWNLWPGVSGKTKKKIEDSFKIPGSMQIGRASCRER